MDEVREKSTTREEWRKRVERWRDSGLTAKQFATETGLNAGTLQYWRSKLKRPVQSPISSRRLYESRLPAVIELRAPVVVDARFEVELKNGRRVRVPLTFEAAQLQTLVTALETM